jgi:hypothetical protein
MKKTKEKNVTTRIVCARCGKVDYVSFVVNNKRDYFCEECLLEFNKENQQGKIKTIKTNFGKTYYEFYCSGCEKLVKQKDFPYKNGDVILCKNCEEELKRTLKKHKRGNIIIAK